MSESPVNESSRNGPAETGSMLRALLDSRLMRALLAFGVLGVAVFAIASYRWFAHPRLDTPTTADAVMVLDGGGDLREHLGVHYLAIGVADTIVFSNPGGDDRQFNANQYCNAATGGRLPAYTQICFDPAPSTTRGEVQQMARIAQEMGWDHIVLVASVDQTTRARRLMERCFDGQIDMVAVAHDQNLAKRVVYEWGANLKASLTGAC